MQVCPDSRVNLISIWKEFLISLKEKDPVSVSLKTTAAEFYNVEEDMQEFLETHPGVKMGDIPADLLTASGSGLDPNITPKSAQIQIPAISAASGLSEEELEKIVKENTSGKVLGVFGHERVNVLKCNLAIAEKIGEIINTFKANKQISYLLICLFCCIS